MDKRQTHVIDDLLDTFQNENFSIEYIITKCMEEDTWKYVEDLKRNINNLSKNKETNYNNTPNFFETIIGGEKESYKLEDVHNKYLYRALNNELLSIYKADGGQLYILEIIINSDNKRITNSIRTIFKNFSMQTTYPSVKVLATTPKENFGLYTSSAEIATVAAFPTIERPGLKQKKYVAYGQDIPETDDRKALLGKLHSNYKTHIDVGIKINDLVRHGFISGVTGSGKTSTIKVLLSKLYNKKIPFTVIEPAKTEYSNLENIYPNVYVLGGDNTFQMNPFAFPSGVHVQTHLDLLKSVFNASFPMYGPMPYILETALIKAYQNRGWSLYSGNNIYQDRLPIDNLFPNLKDLYNLIDEVAGDIGYSKDLSSDVKGALKVRIGSLMVGAKGKILNNRSPIDLNRIMKEPSVIELEKIGDNQEKAFFMGLFLISIYENYVAENKYSKDLKNLLVIEEAHRLLENIPSIENNEIASVKGNALETFNNILSEIRAYGQGILVADQIPTKLSPEVIKNTNLKIVHRMFARDDREVIGNSIGLDDEQIDDLINLDEGQAVVFFDEL
ncbi:MAG: ATP-binding protein, partial [bacterium]